MSTRPVFQPLMRPGVDPFSATHKPLLPPTDYHRRTEQGLLIERNCTIRLRDGVEIFADLYRPEDANGPLPILLAWGPYGKHATTNKVFWPRSGVDPDWLSDLTSFEAPDPVWWGRQGYGVAVVDPRGAWLSGGDFHHNGIQEAEDCADTIEWLGSLAWSNGCVGMSGVSYLAAIQYYVAPLKPGPLRALNICEGFSDWYREFARHGGILETNFLPRASDNIRFSLNRTEDTWANVLAHPLMDDYWQSKACALEQIGQPAYVIASWSDQALHLRGTIAAWRRMSSREKWLEIHGQKKWAYFYRPETRERQRAFFDHYLLQRETSLSAWPPVRLEVRERHGVQEERAETEWPLARTDYKRLHLGGANGRLESAPTTDATIEFEAGGEPLHFDHRFDEPTELTGHASLRLWVEALDSDDMDIFVALQKLDRNGDVVGFTFYAFFENGPVALGWLRASHRALDEAQSTPERPVHRHDGEQLLRPGEIVPVDVELWPFSVRFEPGESLRLVVSLSDIYRKEEGLMLPFPLHEDTRNRGRYRIHLGGVFESALLLPVVPAREQSK
ncbi:MAG: CocE/NonD family hydrolase [Sphingobium sp.]|nr:CocE/NonD family hydrolase [Sphingobium sp.]